MNADVIVNHVLIREYVKKGKKMAWNEEKKQWECDRCGIRIHSYSGTLCKACETWLEKWVKEHGEEKSNN